MGRTARNIVSDAKARRARHLAALARPELRSARVVRQAAAGPCSAPVKVIDPATRALIEQALARRACSSAASC